MTTANLINNSSEPVLADTCCVRALVLAGGSFPSQIQPVHGVFVKERVRHVAQLPGVDVCVLAPSPYFPPFKSFRRWYPWSQIPRRDVVDGLHVERPKYPLLPKVGGYFHARLIEQAARRALRCIRDFEFDLIDAHFAYPNGAAAVRLSRRLNKPVVITGRGEDIARYPDLPIIGTQVRQALREATQLVAVSSEIAERMERFGADPARITVIPNGVDCQKFQPIPKHQARKQLGLSTSRPLVLAVGYRLELKGFHLLIDAIPAIRARFPDALVAIVGGQARWAADYLPTIEERIRVHNVQDHVLIAGVRPQQELAAWYSAADVLSILSSREGSPNVLMEAMACGLPAVATRVGGIPEVLADARNGMLLPERSAEAAAVGISEALARDWDRDAVRRFAEQKSWHRTAEQVKEVFERAVAEHQQRRES